MASYESNRQELVDEMQSEYGYLFCRCCQRSKGFYKLHCHHIMFRSRFPRHPNLHSKQNLIIVCNICHDELHRHTEKNEALIEARNLKALFA